MAKHLVTIKLAGGRDALNWLSARDSASVSAIQTARAASPTGNILDYTPNITAMGTLTKDSNTITGINTTGLGLVAGMKVYALNLKAQRQITIVSFTANTVVMSDVAYVTATGTINFATPTAQLYKANDTAQTARDPAFHFSQEFYNDTFNLPDISANLAKTKSCVIAAIGPLRKKVYKNGANGSLFGLLVDDGAGGFRAGLTNEIPRALTSHNDQQSTWESNAPEGATKGWGGGIADEIVLGMTSAANIPLASVSASGSSVYTVGSVAKPFGISGNGLIRKLPGIDGKFTNEVNTQTQTDLSSVFNAASLLVGNSNDFMASTLRYTNLATYYQPILNNAQEITDAPLSTATFQLAGSDSISAAPLLANLKQIARLILANNPNRGGLATRTGNVATIATLVTNAKANRTAGSTLTTITDIGHGLFTSTLSSNTSDSVIVLGAGVDSSPTSGGYKITLVPGNEDNQFTFNASTGNTSALVDVDVTVRLKHNLNAGTSKAFISDAGFDSTVPVEGYTVQSVIDETTFTVNTVASGALTPASKLIMFKIIDLPKQVIFSESGMGWDSHSNANSSQMAALNHAYKYYNGLIERIKNADVVTCEISDFGRTIGTNGTGGTDHAWAGSVGVFGKSVRGNKIYGTIPDYSATGPDLFGGSILRPTTAVYQYAATFAKWMGLSDAKILALFPDLVNWPANERTLPFLDPFV